MQDNLFETHFSFSPKTFYRGLVRKTIKSARGRPSLSYSSVAAMTQRVVDHETGPTPHVYPTSPSQFTSNHISAIVAAGPFPAQIVSLIRSDHAGETGAVWIYKGALSAANVRSWLSRRPVPPPPVEFDHSLPKENANKSPWDLAYDMIYMHLEAEQQVRRIFLF